jgi:hypothetical protein
MAAAKQYTRNLEIRVNTSIPQGRSRYWFLEEM